jgi:hypothetical protein
MEVELFLHGKSFLLPLSMTLRLPPAQHIIE